MPEAVFVGGGTGGGKTTVARALAGQQGLRLLQIDHFWYAHSERAGETPPTPDVQWLEWTPATQAADFERLSRLMLGFVLEDLPTLPDQPLVLVEGPQIVADLLPEDAHAVFLIATPEFQRSVLRPRPMPSSDPKRALAARLVKDRLYAQRIAALAQEHGFPVIEVDGSRSPEAILEQVVSLFGEPLSRNQPTDLAAVRRWENDNMLRNVRAWVDSGEHPSAAGLAFPLACECGDLGCVERVSLTLREVENPHQPVLATGHKH
jgi:hypothetical protein